MLPFWGFKNYTHYLSNALRMLISQMCWDDFQSVEQKRNVLLKGFSSCLQIQLVNKLHPGNFKMVSMRELPFEAWELLQGSFFPCHQGNVRTLRSQERSHAMLLSTPALAIPETGTTFLAGGEGAVRASSFCSHFEKLPWYKESPCKTNRGLSFDEHFLSFQPRASKYTQKIKKLK